MLCSIQSRAGHYVVVDDRNRFLFSADSYGEALADIRDAGYILA